MRLFSIILLLFVLAAPVALKADTATSIYWPLHDGDVTHFSGTNIQTDLKLVEDDSHGAPRFNESIYFSTNANPATNLGGSLSLVNSNSIVKNFGGVLGSNSLTFTPAWSILNDSVLTLGGTLSSSFTATIGSTNTLIGGTTVVKSAGTVTVPAGLYRDCWSVQLTLSVFTKKVLVQDYILAPHVGIIKIGILNSNFVLTGWQSLTGGTVGGVDVTAYTNLNLLRITKQPLVQSPLTGGSAKFSVTASGNLPLTFQWTQNGTNLIDDSRIHGTLTSNLTVNIARASDAGSYAVVVRDLYGSISSSSALFTVKPDAVVPTLTITTPTAGSRTTTTLIAGAVADNLYVSHVYYWFTNINHGVTNVSSTNEAALHGTNFAKLTWDAVSSPLPGTNTLVVIARDFQGNFSKPVTRAFFYKVPTAFALTITGDGSGKTTGAAAIAGDLVPTNSVLLNIGEGYTVTATPDNFSFFTNWTGSLGTVSTNKLTFIMEAGLTLQANFATNHFLRMTGTYNGLFMVNNSLNDARLESAGMISSLSVSRLGVYSGKMILGGLSYPISGKFNLGGQGTNVITRSAAAGGKVNLAMTLEWDNDHRIIQGQVSGTNGGAWVAPLLMIVNSTVTNSLSYTLSVPSTNDSPAGTGGLMLTNKVGVVTMSGALADGAAPVQTVPIDETLSVPIYASLYAKSGLIMGWLDMNREDTTGDHVPAGNLMWLKKASHSVATYTNGFTNVITVQGSVWTMPPKGIATLPFTTNAPGLLSISGGALSNSISFNVAVTTNNVITKVSGATNSLTGTIDPKTGLVKITFGNGLGKATTAAQGVVQQIATNAAGAFLGKTNSGGFTITPINLAE